ncbi:LysR substrate-binding domain-containing protein [Carnimonas nigrificans]|uniref:LysR substrate-binding domain-containing protein n=1 Tax=Carnimonas nigrificans TaxID=64323 RepID=UPI000472EFE4|nr:LysR substrate-binding domain-containing protein [Carnimonas nigrificans]
MPLESRALRYFVILAEELHFGRAAARLNIVQPALSAQIKTLETSLGTVLLHRSRRHVELTAAGERFLIEARRAVTQLDHAEEVGRQVALGRAGVLNIGFVGSAPFAKCLPWVISRFRHTWPDVELSLQEQNADDQMQHLHERTLDVGFVRLPLPGSLEGLQLLKRVRESIMVAVPVTHPLANAPQLRPSDLVNETFVAAMSHESAGWAATLRQIGIDSGGTSPRIIQSSPHLATVVSLVNAGLGIALVPDSLHSLDFDNVRYIPLEGDRYSSDVAVLMREEPSTPLIANFLTILDQFDTHSTEGV